MVILIEKIEANRWLLAQAKPSAGRRNSWLTKPRHGITLQNRNKNYRELQKHCK